MNQELSRKGQQRGAAVILDGGLVEGGSVGGMF